VKTSEILNLTADYLEEFGVGRSWFPTYGEPACLEGAGKAVCQKSLGNGWIDRWYDEIKPAISAYLAETRPDHAIDGVVYPWLWFDLTKGAEAVEVLRAAAAVEQAKESEPVKTEAPA
jgi:hypothetical protein